MVLLQTHNDRRAVILRCELRLARLASTLPFASVRVDLAVQPQSKSTLSLHPGLVGAADDHAGEVGLAE